MNKLIVLSLLIAFTLIQCGKKMTDNITSTNSNIEKSWRNSAPSAAPAKIVQLGDYQSYDMKNGLKVILVENHKRPTVSVQMSLNHDQILEGDKVGYVSMAGDLISKGTAKRTKSELDNAIDFIGAKVSSSSAGVFGSSLKKHSNELVGIMSEMILEASFPEDEFEKSKKQAISGITMSLSNAEAMMSNVTDVVVYGSGHPYGEVQTLETTEKIDLLSCKQYYETYFRPNNAYLILVGDLTLEESKVLTDKYFSQWQSGIIPNVEYSISSVPEGNNVAFVHKENAVQSVINITYPIDLKPGSPEIIKSSVMNAILGGGIFSGRLMQNLREDKAYTYGARSRTVADPLVGYFNAFANVRNEVTDSSVTQFLFEMKRLVTEKVSEEDLQLVKNSMTGGFARSLESPQTIARFARNTFKYDLPKDYYKNYLKDLSNISVEDINMMAKKYIRPENSNIVVVGDKSTVAKTLESFDSNNKIDYYDAYGVVIKELEVDINDITPKEILSRYIKAIGGMEKVKSTKTMGQVWKMDLMGQTATIEKKWDGNKKFLSVMKMGVQVLQEQKFDGVVLKNSAMGNTEEFTSGEEFEMVVDEAKMFEQVFQFSNMDLHTMKLEGAEVINGEECFKVVIVDGNENKSTVFYSIDSGLLIRKVVNEEMGGEIKTIISDFKNYKEYEGVFIPSTLLLNGVMPMPVSLVLLEVNLNETYTNYTFE